MPAKKRSKKSTSRKSVAFSSNSANASTRKTARGGRRRLSAKKRAGKRGTAANLRSGSKVMVINMIPQALSFETNQDSEPTLAVNPANPNQIAGSAFTPDAFGGRRAPIFVSNDGGVTWFINTILPTVATGDITVAFGSKTNKLYAGILRDSSGDMEVFRTDDFAGPQVMKRLMRRVGPDQPYTQAVTMPGGPGAGKDALYVGNNADSGPDGQTATIDLSLNASANAPRFKQAGVATRSIESNGASIRPACHTDGTIYAAFYDHRDSRGSFDNNTLFITSADVVVVRDDNWGKGLRPFTDLIDPGDGSAGIRVVQNIAFPYQSTGDNIPGQQRTGGDIAIATDPNNSSIVYLAYADKLPGSDYTMHVRFSKDRGETWSADVLTIPKAINCGLAIDSDGRVGLLCQQLVGAGAALRWVTQLQRIRNGAITKFILASVPADSPVLDFDPYLGDYAHLQAVGRDFFGIFSANNTPDLANFPSGVVFQRNHDFNTSTLFDVDGTTPVNISIDPFFFKVSR